MDPLSPEPLPLGQPAPDFTLRDLAGTRYRLADYRGRVVVLNFWSAECPHAARADRALQEALLRWGGRVTVLNIASNANEPPELIAAAAGERGIAPPLVDADQQVADLYRAQTTPHLFVIDAAGLLRYQGALDDVTFRQRTPTRFHLVGAVEAVLAGLTPDPAQTPAYGCTVVRYS